MMIGILDGVKNNSLISCIRKDYKLIKKLIILGIIMSYVGKIILLGI
jgi:hypothetical protein